MFVLSQKIMLNSKPEIFDVCLILLQSVINDARTLNIARTLRKNGKSVGIIGLGNKNDAEILAQEGIFLFPLEKLTNKRLIFRLPEFYKHTRSLRNTVQARSFWAEDVYSLPPATHFARMSNSSVIYDAREIYSAIGALHNRPITQKLITMFEKYYARKATKIFTSGDLDSDYLEKYLNVVRPAVVMNVPPFREPKPSEKLRNFGKVPPEMKILVYQGMISEGRGILPVISALPHLPNVVFCLLGSAENEFEKKIRTKSKKLGVSERVFFCGKIPYDELPTWTASADAGVAFIEPISLSYEFALPNKLFEYCMAGIPALVSDLPALKKILEEFSCGVIAPSSSDSIALADFINKLLSENRRKEFIKYCHLASAKYCFEAQENTILELLSDS